MQGNEDMLSNRLSAWLGARNIHYGWVVAATTFLTMLATAGAMGSVGVLIGPLEKEFGWSNASISGAISVRLVLFGLLGPFAAAFMNQFGIRRVVVTALVLISGGIVGSFFMTQLWHMVLFWGVILGIGTGMTALVLGATVATRWFSERRGLVVAMMTVSNATGQLVFLPLIAHLTETIGWRSALTVVVAALAAAMLLVLALVRDYPAQVGLPPFGERAILPLPARTHTLGQLLLAPLKALYEVSSSPTFWVLFGTFFICGLSTNGLIQTHWISICGDFNIDAVNAAGLLAMVGIFDFAGTLFAGWLSDRYDNRYLLFWFYGLRGLSLIYLSMSGFGIAQLTLFAVFYGLDWVATVPPTVKLSAEKFGREKANVVFGWIFAGHQLGAATATFGAGTLRTDYASYMPALQIAGGMCLVAALSVLFLARPKAKVVAAGVA
jgi:MFS family permease